MGKLALVTGASRGLGETISTFLAGMGYDLIVTARGQRILEAHASSVRDLGINVQAISGDVSNSDDRMELLRAVSDWGGLDLLVNNASELGPSPLPALMDHPLYSLKWIFEVNFFAPLVLSQLMIPPLKSRSGWIINISSDAALGGYEGWGGYGSSKAALDLASLTMAHELRGDGVTVVSVDPGDMQTEMHRRAAPDEDLSHLPSPAETLPFWAWLLSQEPDSVNGSRFEAQGESWQLAIPA